MEKLGSHPHGDGKQLLVDFEQEWCNSREFYIKKKKFFLFKIFYIEE